MIRIGHCKTLSLIIRLRNHPVIIGIDKICKICQREKNHVAFSRENTRRRVRRPFKQNDVEQGACKYRPDTITIDRIYK